MIFSRVSAIAEAEALEARLTGDATDGELKYDWRRDFLSSWSTSTLKAGGDGSREPTLPHPRPER